MKSRDERMVLIPTRRVVLEGDVRLPKTPSGLVMFTHGSGSSRFSPRNRFVADVLEEAGDAADRPPYSARGG